MAFLKKYKLLKRSVDGNVTVELALIMTVLVLVILYGLDFSRMAIEKHRLEQFARAGTQYGLLGQSEAQDADGIELAVEDAAGVDAGDLTISITNFCECPDGSSVDCDSECATEVPNLFLTVTVTRDYDYMFGMGKDLAGNVTLSGTSTVRVR